MKIPNEYKKHFMGKICTIFTTPINRDFQKEGPERYPDQIYKYFVGAIEDISDAGVLLQQATTGLKSWISASYIISIAEEEVEYLTEDDVKVVEKPEKIITTAQLKEKFPNEFETNPDYTDIDALQKISDLVKQENKASVKVDQ